MQLTIAPRATNTNKNPAGDLAQRPDRLEHHNLWREQLEM